MPKLSKRKLKQVMVFGVFDKFHPGHESFLRQAAAYGRVIAVVAQDEAVKKIKGRAPSENERLRLKKVRSFLKVERAVFGDHTQGTYAVIKKYRPDVICLGYDQNILKKDLDKKIAGKRLPTVQLIQLFPHHPDKFHTSLKK